MITEQMRENAAEMRALRAECTSIQSRAASEGRELTREEMQAYNAKAGRALNLESALQEATAGESQANKPGSLMHALGGDPKRLFTGNPDGNSERPSGVIVPQVHPKEAALRNDFSTWAGRTIGMLTGAGSPPAMEATAPSGVISVGTGTNLDSIGFAIPTMVLPFLRSYLQFAPFEQAGASLLPTDHMRPVNLPVVAAGAPPSTYAEGTGPAEGPSGSTPFGLSGFTFGATKYARQVIASWESLQSTEVPLDGMILDELVTSIANAVTQAATTKLYSALTTPPNYTIETGSNPPLQIVGGSTGPVQNDVYGLVTALRHSLPDGLEGPECAFMLSRASLAIIRNTRASTSGVPMFNPNDNTILGRRFVTNEYFDATCGAGFITYGNWNKGAWIRKTPLITRPLLEKYWVEGNIGFMATTWTDAHFLAELVGAAEPPTFQPLYYTVLPSSLQG